MKKTIVLLLCVISVFAEVSKTSLPNIMSPSTAAKASEVNENWQNSVNNINILVDTVNGLRAKQKIDSLTSDTIYTPVAEIDTLFIDTTSAQKIHANKIDISDAGENAVLRMETSGATSRVGFDFETESFRTAYLRYHGTGHSTYPRELVLLNNKGGIKIATGSLSATTVIEFDEWNDVLIPNGVLTITDSAYVAGLSANALNVITTITTDSIYSLSGEIDTLTGDTAYYSKFEAGEFTPAILTADTGFITSVESPKFNFRAGTIDTVTIDTSFTQKISSNKIDISNTSGNSMLTVSTDNADDYVGISFETDYAYYPSLRYYGTNGFGYQSEVVLAIPGGGFTVTTGTGGSTAEALVVTGGRDVNIPNGVLTVNDSAYVKDLKVSTISINDTGSFTLTLTGCTTSPTGTCFYTKIGNVVTLELPNLYATSNSTVATLTGLPDRLKTPGTSAYTQCFVWDNGDVVSGYARFTSVISIELVGDVFQASGNKGVYSNFVTYRIR